jgi:hypothetical protein
LSDPDREREEGIMQWLARRETRGHERVAPATLLKLLN